MLDLRREWSVAKLGLPAIPSTPAPTASEPYPILTGPIADECARVVRDFIEAMVQYERHWLKLRPLRPFGFSEFSEQRVGDRIFNSGSTGIVDEAEARPEEDLVRLMQGDDLTDAEKDRVLRVGVYFDEAMMLKEEIYRKFWIEMPDDERNWFHYNDPPAFEPGRNQVAEIRRISQDHIVVLLEKETEAGTPADRGYHLRPVDGHWRISHTVNYREDVCQYLRLPPRNTTGSSARPPRIPVPRPLPGPVNS